MARKKIKKLLRLIADNLIEFGKLSFAGFVIGGILSDNQDKMVIVTVGIFSSVVPVVVGILVKTYLEEE
jgi:hypothetical protein